MPLSKKLKILLQSKKFIILSLIFILLYILIFTKIITYETKLDLNDNTYSGKIESFIIDGNKLSMLVNGEEKVQVTYYIKTKEEKEKLQQSLLIGDQVILKGEFNIPYNNTIPNIFNYREYLYNHQIYTTFSADTITLSNQTSFFNQIKTNFMRKIDKVGSSSAYLHALILGEISYIDNDIYQEYQKNGTTHLFAVSGMHVSALALFLSLLFQKIHLKELIGNTLIIFFLLFYMFLVGFTPSVLRGGLLFIFLLINKKFNIHLNTLVVLYLLFLLLALINPFYIYDLGFIYSFTTSFGLILFSKKITGNAFMKLLKISAIAFLFSFPITVYNFYEINLLTILNNVIIVPLVTSILFPLTLITFILPFLNSILMIGIYFLEWLTKFLNAFAINLVVPQINFIFIFLYYIGVYFIYKGKFKYFLFLVILTITYKLFPVLDRNSYVYFLDVGQGDSTLIVASHRKYVILIDTGGKITWEEEEWEKKNKVYDASRNTVTFLKSLGITKIDLLIGTHGDIDHIGYAKNIMKNIKVKNLWLNYNMVNELEKELLDINLPNNFDKLPIINLNKTIREDENESSLVLYFNLENINFLIMGDASKEIEKNITNTYSFAVDVIKIGHHGSKTSSDKTFLTKFKPKYAIISAGRNNSYNHPSSETLQTLNELRIPYFSTQEKGSIEYVLKDGIKKINFYPP